MPSSGRWVQLTSCSNATDSGPPHFGSNCTVHGPLSSCGAPKVGKFRCASRRGGAYDGLAEHHEHRAVRGELERQSCPSLALRPSRGQARRPADRVPQLGRLARHAEGAIGFRPAVGSVGDEVDLSVAGGGGCSREWPGPGRRLAGRVPCPVLEVGLHAIGQTALRARSARRRPGPCRTRAAAPFCRRNCPTVHPRSSRPRRRTAGNPVRLWVLAGFGPMTVAPASTSFLQLAQHRQRDRLRGRAAPARDSSCRRAARGARRARDMRVEDDFLGDDVVVVAGQHARRVAALELGEVRHVVAVVVAGVGHEQALLEQELAAVDVGEERRRTSATRWCSG